MADQLLVKVKVAEGKEYALERTALAWIDSKECVNCGICREYCPVEAISERQREVCRICPGCAPKPGVSFDDMREISANHSCTIGCPLGISPQGYINLLRIGKLEEAYKLIWDKTPFPAVLGRICHHPCEEECKRGLLMDEALKIRAIKRYLAEEMPVPEGDPYPIIHEETVAIIGAGPAGLSAAHDLAKAGYEVTVYDAAQQAGGMLIRGIPTFRLPREVVAQEVGLMEDFGVNFQLGEYIGPKQMEELLQTYDAVLVATGMTKAKKLNLEGWELEGIYSALEYMDRVNYDQDLYRHPGQQFVEHGDVVVIGGGSVAMDTARVALRNGAKSVTAVCVECGDEVPAHDWELKEAKEEGVVLMEGWMPVSYIGEQPRLDGVKLIQVESIQKVDQKINCVTIPGTEKVIKADLVIEAIGQKADPVWKEYQGNPKVYYAGDVQSGDVSVVNAMAAGKKAALDIDNALRGRTLKDPLRLRTISPAPINEKIYPAVRLKEKQYPTPVVPVAERIHNFDEVELVMNELEAIAEVNRCLECGYQFVDPEKCIGCGVCVRVCPVGGVIHMKPVAEEER